MWWKILFKILFDPKVGGMIFLILINKIKNNMSENQQANFQKAQPLFLPHGSVRATITLFLLSFVAGSFIWHYPCPEEIYAVTLVALGYYVGYRTDNAQLKEIKK
jgi:hypothetical protein